MGLGQCGCHQGLASTRVLPGHSCWPNCWGRWGTLKGGMFSPSVVEPPSANIPSHYPDHVCTTGFSDVALIFSFLLLFHLSCIIKAFWLLTVNAASCVSVFQIHCWKTQFSQWLFFFFFFFIQRWIETELILWWNKWKNLMGQVNIRRCGGDPFLEAISMYWK